MASTSELAKGVVIRHQNDLFVVTETKFVSPGKGSAFTRTRMKSLTSGKSIEVTYKSSETVDLVEVENRRFQYSYKSGDLYSFMDQESYESYEVSADVLGDDAKYLKDDLDVHVIMHGSTVVAVVLPKKIQYKVTEAPPAIKGDTANNARLMKDVVMENGLVVRVPIFIKEGEDILVNTETGEYCERVNS